MNELLRLANELIEAREKAPISPWSNTPYATAAGDGKSIFHNDRLNSSLEFIVLAGNHAVDIIKGYQSLIKAALLLMPHANFIPYKELETLAKLWITEATASIPEEP